MVKEIRTVSVSWAGLDAFILPAVSVYGPCFPFFFYFFFYFHIYVFSFRCDSTGEGFLFLLHFFPLIFFSLSFKSVFRGAGDFIPLWFYLLSVCFVLMV